jgi:hypothetical protein
VKPPTVAEIDGLPALVVLEGGWRDEYAARIEREGLAALSIMVFDDDLSFLERLPELRGLVLNAGQVRHLSPVQALAHLETLTLNTPGRPKLSLDFTAFRALRSLGVYWNAGFTSLFDCASLETLWVFSPPDEDLTRFGELPVLRRLEVSQGRKLRSSGGLGATVEFLGLYLQGALTELSGLPIGLRDLAVESCKGLDTLEAVATVPGLHRLKVADCGDIASLAPLASLTELESFYAWESTKILDGDLSVLLELPRLGAIGLQDRRHYTPRVPEIEAALRAR